MPPTRPPRTRSDVPRARQAAALSPASVATRAALPSSANMDDFKLDWERIARTGTAEAVLCDPKTASQIDAIVAHAQSLARRLLLTRLERAKLDQLDTRIRQVLDYDEVSRTAILGPLPAPRGPARVAIVCGGTSDVAVAGEAARTLAFAGEASSRFVDVGVAG